MNDAALVRRRQPLGNLPRNPQRLFQRQRPLQFLALHQFHHQRALLDAVHRRNVRMV